MTGGLVTQADRARWQRQAARELAAVLDAHDGLPPITWLVALALDESRERPGGGTVFLRASARRGGVKVQLTATVFAEDGQ